MSATTATLHFTQAEYDARLAATRTAMEAAGVDVLIVSDPSNMNWLTGYDSWSFYVHQAVIVTPQGEPLWFGRGMDAESARLTAWIADASLIAYPDHYVQSTERHPMDYLSAQLIDRGFGAARIGVELDNYWFSAAAFASLSQHMPDASFTDCTNLVNWRRAIKSEAEIGYMRNAARIVEAMHARIRDKVTVGMRKCDLVAEIYDASLRGVPGLGGDYPAIVPLLPSGREAAAAHMTWDERPMKGGEGTFFEIAGCYRRYHCPLSRTVFLGKPTQAFVDAEKAVSEGMEAGLAAARPGNLCEDIAIAFFDTLARHGIEKDSRTGYPIGLSYPPDWGEHTMSLRRGDKTELRPGMTLHFMTGLWMAEMGFEMTESILITETGVECLANVPRELVVKD